MLAQGYRHFTAADTTHIIVWSMVLAAILIVAFVIVMKVKRRIRDDIDTNPTASSGFTLANLRQMHREGLLSDEELEKAKAKLVLVAKRGVVRDPAEPKPDYDFELPEGEEPGEGQLPTGDSSPG